MKKEMGVASLIAALLLLATAGPGFAQGPLPLCSGSYRSGDLATGGMDMYTFAGEAGRGVAAFQRNVV